ncbi:MAG: hypothetical protein ACR2NM_04530 [Bythopirellula sp.]
MARLTTIRPLFALACLAALVANARASESLDQRAAAVLALLEDGESRYVAHDTEWYETTRRALAEEAERVGEALDSHGEQYAAAWKQHLRWPLLTSNLGSPAEVDLSELALVRRWLYSNRKGLEYPFFAELRKRSDAHLDAVYTFSHPNLAAEFHRQVQILREQIITLADDPSDAHAAALGRTLGWFERSQQLEPETAAARKLLSLPNARIIVSKPLIDRAIDVIASDVEQSLPVTDRMTVPNGGLLGRPSVANVRGIARTHGRIAVDIEASDEYANLQLVYRGEIDSRCRAVIGPVTVAMRTLGPVKAITPIQLSMQGIKLVTTEVFPEVRTRVTGVSARSQFIRRVGERRAREPASYRRMNSRASEKAASVLQEEMDERVETVIEDIRSELQQAQSSLDNFREVLAPVVREGATPYWESIESSAEAVVVNVASRRREQFGAATYSPQTSSADIQVQLHVSFFNNMLETIMAGKTFTDKYFMRYGKVLQPQLPPQLMVHARSIRWALIAAKPRPFELTIPAPNQFVIQLTAQRIDIGDEQFTGPTLATVRYELQQDEFGEYRLHRQGEVELDSPIPAASQQFLLQKLNAFFAPVLDGGGVAVPTGGTLGRLSRLQPQSVLADQNWLTLGIDVPTEFMEDWLPVANP